VAVVYPEMPKVVPQTGTPRFGLRRSAFWAKVFVFGQPVQVVLAGVLFYYMAQISGGPFLLLIPLLPVVGALNVYLHGVRFAIRLEVRDGQLVWSGLFSERSVPLRSVVGAHLHRSNLAGTTVRIDGAPDMSVLLAYKEWNKFANAVNHYHPGCGLPLYKTFGKWSVWMKFFQENEPHDGR
jgi:hypothetical protein